MAIWFSNNDLYSANYISVKIKVTHQPIFDTNLLM